MPKTSFLVEARQTDISYLLPTSTLSGSKTRYYVGVTWDATAATTGTVKIGQLEKKYDSSRPSYSETSWEGMVTWMPRTYSKVDLYSSRQPVESTGLGDFILSDASGIVWSHGWNSVFTTDANARYVKDRYQGFDRTDETTGYGIKASYKMRRWLTLGAEYQYTNRDSRSRFQRLRQEPLADLGHSLDVRLAASGDSAPRTPRASAVECPEARGFSEVPVERTRYPKAARLDGAHVPVRNFLFSCSPWRLQRVRAGPGAAFLLQAGGG